MEHMAGFIRWHPVLGAMIIVVGAVVVLPPLLQSPVWFWRLFFRRNYYGWLLRRRRLIDLAGRPYGDTLGALVSSTFGDPVKAIEYFARNWSAEAEELLIGVLSTRHRGVYQKACAVLADMGSLRAVPVLVRHVRQWGHRNEPAGQALKKLARATPDVARLLAASVDGSAQDGHVVSLLQEIGDLDAILDILPALAARSALLTAIPALADSKNPRAAAAVMAVAAQGDERLASAVACTLARVGGPECVDYLANILVREAAAARRAAADALGALRVPAAVAPLARALADPDPQVRALAARSLGRVGDRAAVEPLLQAMLDDPAHAHACAGALGLIGDPRALLPLAGMIACLPQATDAILAAIKRIGGSRGADAAIAALSFSANDEPVARKIAAVLVQLVSGGGTAAEKELVQMLSAPEAYEPLAAADVAAVVRWAHGGGELRAEVSRPVYREEPCYGPYGEDWGTTTVLAKKGALRLVHRPEGADD